MDGVNKVLAYEPAVGDVVVFNVNGEPESGEVCELLSNATVGVLVTEQGSLFQGQKVYFNAGQLALVPLRRVQ